MDFQWGEAHQHAFEELKGRHVAAPILSYPTSEGLFILDTDVSNFSIGAVLSQLQEGEEKAYASSHLLSTNQHYCVIRGELLSLVKFTRQFRHYLLGRQIVLRMVHNSLEWLFHFKHPEGQLARWLEELSLYDRQIKHRAGARHGNADALSQKEPDSSCDCYHAGKDVTTLTCSGCSHCRRVYQQ